MDRQRTSQLREKNVSELLESIKGLKEQLCAEKTELMTKRDGKVTGSVKKIRKAIAQTLTVVREKQINEAKLSFEGKRHVPKELRPKLTRAMRKRLTKEQTEKRVPKAERRMKEWAQRKVVIVV